MNVVIKTETIVTADLSYTADVLTDGGVITEIGPKFGGATELDATGSYVMPGGIDPHVHLEMPLKGTYSSDNSESGTRSGLAGGTTMVVNFWLHNSGESLLDAIKRWDNKSNCNYFFQVAVTWWGEQVFNDIKTVVQDRGINTSKHFLAYRAALMVNDDELFSSFKRLSKLGATALVHAENGDIVAEMTAKLLAEGNNGPVAHAYSRPSQVEGEATNRAIMIADMAGVPLYVLDVSCEEAHEAIRRARQNGQRVWGEPLIQHLTLDESGYFHPDLDHAARRVMSPPFRNKKHQDSLWAGLMSGSLSIVATGRLTPNEYVAVTSTNITKILNCYPRKGAILADANADLVVWDSKKEKTITADTQERHGRFVERAPMGTVNTALSHWKELTAPRPIERSGIPAAGV